ncbi:MAG: LacI family DNA-binding transcriptional regulator [Eubacterium sp.]|nr:LacI family DNA-binding transcriptional regulator [Eubacterium sp.]
MKNGEKKKTIGLVLEDAHSDFSKSIIHSVVHAMMNRKDMRLIVIPGRQDVDPVTVVSEDIVHRYKRMYNLIYPINGNTHFDGLIFTLPNYRPFQDEIFGNVPKVFVATKSDTEVTVNYNDEMGIREAIDYLVKIKGVTKICMIGGRDENADAQKRKRIFIKSLEDNGLIYSETMYEKSDMSENSHAAAAKLLKRNPDVQAVFCVNDPSACGLYDMMRKKGLVPGKDIYVFGFDNAAMAGNMVPPLASIGCEGITLGQKALEMLLDMMNGKEVVSDVVPTRLFGRESFDYDMYDFSAKEIISVDSAFIYRFFDKCFYRYRNEVVDSKEIDLRRLFYEILSRMLRAMKDRYMSEEKFEEIRKLIDILFENRIMMYTDSNRFVRSLTILQNSMNEIQKTIHIIPGNNRLFSYMKDKAIHSQALRRNIESRGYINGRNNIFEFLVSVTRYEEPGEEALNRLIENFDKLGFINSALYLYDEPHKCDFDSKITLPDKLNLKCVIKGGEFFSIPKERQSCSIENIFNRGELPHEKKGYISYPLFYGEYMFGVLVCGLTRELVETGEFITSQLGRAIYINWIG